MSATARLHQGMPILQEGAPLAEASACVVMLHGRGAGAEDILALGGELNAPGVAFVAPQAANATWYPNRFIAPVATNEPWLASALAQVGEVLALAAAAGIPLGRTMLLGFSQGGCLALEYAARHPAAYGALVGLSAALIENGDQPRAYTGSLQGVSVLLGCSDVDFHIPLERVDRTATIFAELGATVDKRIYPGLGHTVNRDEIARVGALVAGMMGDR